MPLSGWTWNPECYTILFNLGDFLCDIHSWMCIMTFHTCLYYGIWGTLTTPNVLDPTFWAENLARRSCGLGMKRHGWLIGWRTPWSILRGEIHVLFFLFKNVPRNDLNDMTCFSCTQRLNR